MAHSAVEGIQADVAVGVFLVLSAIAIMVIGDRTYALACFGVGLLFLARALTRAWFYDS
ncbi:hypothetical protein [Halopenitus sp. POP-27]|uniref:hypothetical protein n=1 Tax=Halopenitus sp. POP-27 TaxID=2994425 RepID=UPI0024690F68|nr:hypothetical protein [Halopenitus sp. POP-27]